MANFIQRLFQPKPKTLILIRGLPGSGKTTLAQMLTPHCVAADDYPGLYEGGVYQTTLTRDSHSWCREQVLLLMRQGKTPIAVHNTFVQLRGLEPYIALASEYGYRVQVLTCESKHGSIHGVPDDAILKMRSRWEFF